MLGSDPVPEPSDSRATRGLRIAYVIPAYPPAPSQPFVVNEMVQVQDAGNEVYVVPLYAGERGGAVRHGTFERLTPRDVLGPALVSLRILVLALRTIAAHPLRVA